jgi:hypothetical protein
MTTTTTTTVARAEGLWKRYRVPHVVAAVQEVRAASAKADNQNAVALLVQRHQGSFLIALAKESLLQSSAPAVLQEEPDRIEGASSAGRHANTAIEFDREMTIHRQRDGHAQARMW